LPIIRPRQAGPVRRDRPAACARGCLPGRQTADQTRRPADRDCRRCRSAPARAESAGRKATIPGVDQESKPPALVIAVDQAEELFLAEGQEEAPGFLALMHDLLAEDAPVAIAVCAIRSDSYEQLQEAKSLESVRKIVFDLSPMPKGSYVEVIKGPALRMNASSRPLKIEDTLVDALLVDIEEGGAKDALPLLAFTLERLYVEHGGDGHLTLSAYRRLNGIKGAIEAAVETCLQGSRQGCGDT